MKKSRWLAFVALLSALMLVAAACGSDEEGGDGAEGGDGDVEKIPVTVYFQGALTGPFNYLVVPGFQGAQLRIKELNADPDFPAEITLKQGDTQGSPDQAPPVVEEIAGDPETVALVGPGFSGESAVSGDTYNDAGIPFVTPSATGVALAEEEWDYWYRAIGNDAGQGGLGGQYVASELGAKKLFVADDKSEYGQPLGDAVAESAEAEGVELVGRQGVESGQDDYSALISDVQATGADTFYFGGYDADFAKIVEQAVEGGFEGTMMSGDGSVSSTFIENAGDAAEGVNLSIPSDLGGDFAQTYNDEYGGEASSVPVYAAEGYDVASLIGEGIRSAVEGGSEDPESIREGIKEYLDGLTESPFEGVAKSYAFDPDSHELAAADVSELFFFYEVQGGEMVAVGNAKDLGLSLDL